MAFAGQAEGGKEEKDQKQVNGRQRSQAEKKIAHLLFLFLSSESTNRKVLPCAEDRWICILLLSLQLFPRAAHTWEGLGDARVLPLIQTTGVYSVSNKGQVKARRFVLTHHTKPVSTRPCS